MLYNGTKVTTTDLSGDTLLVRDIIIKYIVDGILRHDATRSDYTVSKLEEDIAYDFPISTGFSVKLSGIADRIDIISEEILQLIDYKSGYKPHLEFASIDSLFNGKAEQRISNIFQTLLYSMILNKTKGVDIRPSLFYASRMINKNYSPLIKVGGKEDAVEIKSYSLVANSFEEQLKALLDELFDPTIPFTQVEDRNSCTYCDYKKICKR